MSEQTHSDEKPRDRASAIDGTMRAAMVGITCGFMKNALGELVLRFEGPAGQVAEVPAHPSLEAQALAMQQRIESDFES